MNGNVYVSNLYSDNASIYDDGTISVIGGSSNSVIATIPINGDARDTVIDPSNGDLYVRANNDGIIDVISGTTNPLIGKIEIVDTSLGIAFDTANGDCMWQMPRTT